MYIGFRGYHYVQNVVKLEEISLQGQQMLPQKGQSKNRISKRPAQVSPQREVSFHAMVSTCKILWTFSSILHHNSLLLHPAQS